MESADSGKKDTGLNLRPPLLSSYALRTWTASVFKEMPKETENPVISEKTLY